MIRPYKGFTIIEVVISIALMSVVFSGIILGYIHTAQRAQWSGCSLAAQALSIQQLEQARAAVWDYSLAKNEFTNLNLSKWTYNTNTRAGSGYSTAILDLPIAGTNSITATNFVTIQTFYFNGQTNPPVEMQMVLVDTVWAFTGFNNKRKCFTNSNASYYGPDNRDASSL